MRKYLCCVIIVPRDISESFDNTSLDIRFTLNGATSIKGYLQKT